MQSFHRPHTSSTVLIIDSDPLMLTAIGAALDMQGYKAVLARTEAVAASALQTQPIDLIILAIEELNSGCEFAARLRSSEVHREVPVVFIVPEIGAQWTTRLQEHGGVYCVLRSVDPYHLIDLVDRAMWLPHLAQRHAAPPANHLHQASDWIKLN